MRARVDRARESGVGWEPAAPEPDSIHDVARWYAAFWVAVFDDRVVGMVGVRRDFREGTAPSRAAWRDRDDVAELRRLRVAPEARRLGIGAALTRAVIDWCRADGVPFLHLHTTSAQLPARALYERLGFRETRRALIGDYESVWYEMELQGGSG
jgi:GNAT superfamily N-acetyltransferase